MKLLDQLTFVSSPVIDLIGCMLKVVNHDKMNQENVVKEKASKEIESWIVETRSKIPKEMLDELTIFFNYESYLGVTLIPYIIKENIYEDIHTFIGNMHRLTTDELFYYFTHTGFGPDEELVDYSDPSKVIPFLEKLNLPETEKWKLSYLIFDGDRTKQRIIKLIERFYYQYYQPREETALAMQAEFATNLKEKISSGDEKYIRELIHQHGVDLKESKSIYIFISYFLDTSLMYMHVKKLELTAFLIGSKHMEVLDIGRGEKETLEAIRAITDERRFTVLQLLKKRPLYGYELAQELGVSNSTVSHHLSALVALHFVRAIRRENKVYYEVDRDEVQKVLRHLEKMITE